MAKTAADMLDRMEALVRRMADTTVGGERDKLFGQRDQWMTEARAIVAELPEPVDPDLIEAREICALVVKEWGPTEHHAANYRSGRHDTDPEVQRALAAIKLGSQAK